MGPRATGADGRYIVSTRTGVRQALRHRQLRGGRATARRLGLARASSGRSTRPTSSGAAAAPPKGSKARRSRCRRGSPALASTRRAGTTSAAPERPSTRCGAGQAASSIHRSSTPSSQTRRRVLAEAQPAIRVSASSRSSRSRLWRTTRPSCPRWLAFGDIADLKTPLTHGHSRGVARLATQAAERLRLDKQSVEARGRRPASRPRPCRGLQRDLGEARPLTARRVGAGAHARLPLGADPRDIRGSRADGPDRRACITSDWTGRATTAAAAAREIPSRRGSSPRPTPSRR